MTLAIDFVAAGASRHFRALCFEKRGLASAVALAAAFVSKSPLAASLALSVDFALALPVAPVSVGAAVFELAASPVVVLARSFALSVAARAAIAVWGSVARVELRIRLVPVQGFRSPTL